MAWVADVGSRTHRTALTSFRRSPRRPCGVARNHAFADTLGRNAPAGASRPLGARGDGDLRPYGPRTPPCSREGAWPQRARPEPPSLRQAEATSARHGQPSSSARGATATPCVQAGSHVVRRRGSHACRRPTAIAQPTGRHRRPAPSQPEACSPPDPDVRAPCVRKRVRATAATAHAQSSILGCALAKGDLSRR